MPRKEVSAISDNEPQRPEPVPQDDDLVMSDEDLDRVFGGMTGTYICAAQLQSSVLQ